MSAARASSQAPRGSQPALPPPVAVGPWPWHRPFFIHSSSPPSLSVRLSLSLSYCLSLGTMDHHMYEWATHTPPFPSLPISVSKISSQFLSRSQLASSCLKATEAVFFSSPFQCVPPQASTPQILTISNPLISGIKTHAAWKPGVSGKTGNLLHVISWGTGLGSLLGSGQYGVMLDVFSSRGEGREDFENKGKSCTVRDALTAAVRGHRRSPPALPLASETIPLKTMGF